MNCVVPNCSSKSRARDVGVSFHTFPLEEHMQMLWLRAIGRLDVAITRNFCVCSRHLDEKYKIRLGRKTFLHPSAVPIVKLNPEKDTVSEATSHVFVNEAEELLNSSLKMTSSCSIISDQHQNHEFLVKADEFNSHKSGAVTTKEHNQKFIQILQIKIKSLEAKLKRKNSIIHNLKRQNKRQKQKVGNMKNLFLSLKDNNLISENLKEVLEKVSGPKRQIFELQLFKSNSKKVPNRYSNEIKAFALNLNFLSPRAYEYVRTTFNSCLPHTRIIRKWYEKVKCAPGFTKESFAAIKKVVDTASNGEKIVVHIVFDEIYIRQQTEWDGKNSHGFVDVGDGGNSDTVATQILFFLAVCINRPWKIPLAYFPIHNITAEQKANILSLCVQNLHETGVEIVGTTFDGASANLCMSKLLGSDVRNADSRGYIEFQEVSGKHILHPDPCHMLKLVRNALENLGAFKDGDGNFIKWEYFVALLRLQEDEGLHLGNKLRKAHIFFDSQKMKVKLAVQKLSRSVADALDFCRDVLLLQQFEGSKGTSKFVRIFNDIFDTLNSRKISEYQDIKRALCESNVECILDFSESAKEYIKQLHLPFGVKLTASRRSVGFLGLIAGLLNLRVLYDRFIDTKILKYLPLYKVNQDHVELFFSSIRTGLGYNNNPTVQQFRARYKKLLFRSQIRDGGLGNCIPLEHIVVLNASDCCPLQAINNSISRPAMIEPQTADTSTYDQQFIAEHSYAADPARLSEYTGYVMEYIAGFVVFKINKLLQCDKCILAIHGESNTYSLINYKSRGLLKSPSKSVVKICKKVEQHIRIYEHRKDENVLKGPTFKAISISVQSDCIGDDLFEEQLPHMLDTQHYSLLVKYIAETYLQTRFHFIAKKQSEKVSIRQRFNKLVHFKGI